MKEQYRFVRVNTRGKRSGQKSVKAVRQKEVKLRGIGFVKQVGFKPGVKERGSYGRAEY